VVVYVEIDSAGVGSGAPAKSAKSVSKYVSDGARLWADTGPANTSPADTIQLCWRAQCTRA
jgi:hypothetical protein